MTGDWLKVAIWGIAAVVLIIVAIWATMALSEDYWTDCKTAYAFCTHRPYHRDCAVWTRYQQPLSITRWHIIRNSATEFCDNNPWHISCGVRVRDERVREECPLP